MAMFKYPEKLKVLLKAKPDLSTNDIGDPLYRMATWDGHIRCSKLLIEVIKP